MSMLASLKPRYIEAGYRQCQRIAPFARRQVRVPARAACSDKADVIFRNVLVPLAGIKANSLLIKDAKMLARTMVNFVMLSVTDARGARIIGAHRPRSRVALQHPCGSATRQPT